MEKHVYKLQQQEVDERDLKYIPSVEAAVLPTFADIRSTMPAVCNQLSLGSCSANSTVACIMQLLNSQKVGLSRLFQYYKTRQLEGRDTSEDTGATNRGACKSLNKTGVCLESLWKYDVTKFSDAPPQAAVKDSQNHRLTAYKAINTLQDIKTVLSVEKKPVIIGIQVYESFESEQVATTGVVPVPNKNTEKYLGGHSVAVVGYMDKAGIPADIKYKFAYSTASGYLIVQNSWGTGWGDKGYFYLPYEFVSPFAFDFWVMEK